MSTPLVRYTIDEVLACHRGGKIEVTSRVPCATPHDLTLAYTPGVAEICKRIEKDPAAAREYTTTGSMVAVVSNGTAILGLGDIGPLAGHPVMEGKCLLFKMLAGVDAFPVSVQEKDPAKLVEIVQAFAVSFGGINLEDIAAPACFTVEAELQRRLAIPVFHDDQHGTATVVLAALLNALRVVGKEIGKVKLVVSGAGASAFATASLLHFAGVEHIVMCDRAGAIYPGRGKNMNPWKEQAAAWNREPCRGSLADAMAGADVFIGLSAADQAGAAEVKRMNRDAIVFAMANPDPEIRPEAAHAGGAAVVATGRSDYPNQINNCLGFPGIFRGALAVQSKRITRPMIVAAAHAIAGLIPPAELKPDRIIVSPFHPEVIAREAAAVAQAAVADGVAGIDKAPSVVYDECIQAVRRVRAQFDATHPAAPRS